MERIEFIKTSILGTMALSFEGWNNPQITHILSLSFDDGFKKSFYRIAEIHEEHGLRACLNVIATGHWKNFVAGTDYIDNSELGNFDDWNTLKSRGHEIMPHSWEHKRLPNLSLVEAKTRIDICLDYFEEHLEGFDSSESVYNYAYNLSTPELDAHALQRVRAVRTGGRLVLKDTRINPIPVSSKPVSVGTWGYGPDFCDDFVEQEVFTFLDGPGGWLILTLHGLDEEGWGPIRATSLDHLLQRLIKIDYLDVLPTGEVLKKMW